MVLIIARLGKLISFSFNLSASKKFITWKPNKMFPSLTKSMREIKIKSSNLLFFRSIKYIL